MLLYNKGNYGHHHLSIYVAQYHILTPQAYHFSVGGIIVRKIINWSPPGHNGLHFADDIFRCIFMNENSCISNFTKLFPLGSKRRKVNIGLGNGLAPNRQKAITWTNVIQFSYAYICGISGRWVYIVNLFCPVFRTFKFVEAFFSHFYHSFEAIRLRQWAHVLCIYMWLFIFFLCFILVFLLVDKNTAEKKVIRWLMSDFILWQ